MEELENYQRRLKMLEVEANGLSDALTRIRAEYFRTEGIVRYLANKGVPNGPLPKNPENSGTVADVGDDAAGSPPVQE